MMIIFMVLSCQEAATVSPCEEWTTTIEYFIFDNNRSRVVVFSNNSLIGNPRLFGFRKECRVVINVGKKD